MHAYNFIDLFAGCGGLSLGLVNAGFEGVFAIEKTDDAFMTFKHNLCDKKHAFKWPKWLPCKNMTTSDLLNSYKKDLEKFDKYCMQFLDNIEYTNDEESFLPFTEYKFTTNLTNGTEVELCENGSNKNLSLKNKKEL